MALGVLRGLAMSPSTRLVGLLLVAACSATPPAPMTSGTEIAVDAFDERFSDALCQLWVRCGRYVDMSACLAAAPNESLWIQLQRKADVAARTVTYDGAQAAACIATIEAAACADMQFDTPTAAINACPNFELGALADGAACDHGSECASTFCKSDPGGPTSGRCLRGTCAPISLSFGSWCGQSNLACPRGSSCVLGVCRLGHAEGGDCTDSRDCAAGLSCAGLGSGKCVRPVHEHERCDAAACGEIGLTCQPAGLDDTTNTIYSECVRAVGRGQPCSTPGQVSHNGPCQAGLVCPLGGPQVCVDLPAVGQACVNGTCGPNATCSGKTCVASPPYGEACP